MLREGDLELATLDCCLRVFNVLLIAIGTKEIELQFFVLIL